MQLVLHFQKGLHHAFCSCCPILTATTFALSMAPKNSRTLGILLLHNSPCSTKPSRSFLKTIWFVQNLPLCNKRSIFAIWWELKHLEASLNHEQWWIRSILFRDKFGIVRNVLNSWDVHGIFTCFFWDKKKVSAHPVRSPSNSWPFWLTHGLRLCGPPTPMGWTPTPHGTFSLRRRRFSWRFKRLVPNWFKEKVWKSNIYRSLLLLR